MKYKNNYQHNYHQIMVVLLKDFYEDKVKSNDLVFSNGKILQEGEHVQFSTQGSGILEGKVLKK